MKEFPNLINHLKDEGKLPCIVFCFNRAYCQRLTRLVAVHFSKEVKMIKSSAEYANKEKEREKEVAKKWKREKKLRDKMDKIATKEAKMQQESTTVSVKSNTVSVKPNTASVKIMKIVPEGEEDITALAHLNSVFKEFPQLTLVSRSSLGEDDASFILEKIQHEDPLFQAALKFGISWHHSGNNAKMRNATEMLFREKFLNVVVATTTLAQVGVF